MSIKQSAQRPYLRILSSSIKSRLHPAAATGKTIVFFAPEAGVLLYLLIEAAAACVLRSLGHRVVFVRCFDLLPRCPVKDMALLSYDATPKQNRDVCLRCYKASHRVLNYYQLDFIDLREVFSSADERVRRAMLDMPGDRLSMCYEGIAVGMLAYYDFAIATKHSMRLGLRLQDFPILDRYIENTIVAIEMVRVLGEKVDFDVLAAFDVYSMMSAARLYAKAQGKTVRTMGIAYHLNGDINRIAALSSPNTIKEQALRLAQWPLWRDLALPPERIAEVIDDFVYRLSNSGTHIYSPNKTLVAEDILHTLKLVPGRRTLVAYTSSHDEHDAMLYNHQGLGLDCDLERNAFSDSLEWLEALIEYVESDPDLQLVVRLHPRIGATARDGVGSPDYARYRELLSGEYERCRVVWPDDAISSYDLAELADLVLIAWTSMGLELARVGVPVLSGMPTFIKLAPEQAIITIAYERNDYFLKLRTMLAEPPSSQRVRLAFRWYNLFYLGNSTDISDMQLLRDRPVPFIQPSRAKRLAEALLGEREALESNRDELIAWQTDQGFELETTALRGQIGRAIHFLVTGIDCHEAVMINVLDQTSSDPWVSSNKTLSINGRYIVYLYDGTEQRRYSPLIARLGQIYTALVD